MSYGTCKKCGCDDNHACVHDTLGSCWWVDETHELCSFCLDSFADDHSIERPFDFHDEQLHSDWTIDELKKLTPSDLHDLADSFGVDPELKSKQGKIEAILDKQANT